MKFLKKLIILLFVATQLNAMKSEANAIIEKPVASDFQIYQLLSTVTKDNPDFYLPHEVTHIIALNAYKLHCYEKYKTCLNTPDTVLAFIEDSLKKSMRSVIIVDILKTCLRCSGKSLSKIRYVEGKTVLHCMGSIGQAFHLDCAKIIRLVAGDEAWDLITMDDKVGSTVFHYTYPSISLINELLSAATCQAALWKLACHSTDNDVTVLHWLIIKPLAADTIKKLLSAAPNHEKAWWLISRSNWFITSPLDLAVKSENREIVDLLESYRPKGQ